MIRAVLADDHPIVRAGIRRLLEEGAGVTIVAECNDGNEALAAIQAHRPELAFLDIAMPKRTGLEVARAVSERQLPTKVILLSMHLDRHYIEGALQAGVAGYVVKGGRPQELQQAVQTILKGDTFVSPALLRDEELPSQAGQSAPPTPVDSLTSRQREVFLLLVQGLTTKEIAFRLGISPKTVEVHRTAIMTCLKIDNLAGLVRLAIRHNLLDATS